MAHDIQKYSKLKIWANGEEWLEMCDVTIKLTPNTQAVKTAAKGLCGFVTGAGEISISIENAVPAAGKEFSLDDNLWQATVYEITIFSGSKTLTTKGAFMDESVTGGLDKQDMQSLEFLGQPASWK